MEDKKLKAARQVLLKAYENNPPKLKNVSEIIDHVKKSMNKAQKEKED